MHGVPGTTNARQGLAERLLRLDGFRVLEVTETAHEVVITVETAADFVGCASCGIRVEPHRVQHTGGGLRREGGGP